MASVGRHHSCPADSPAAKLHFARLVELRLPTCHGAKWASRHACGGGGGSKDMATENRAGPAGICFHVVASQVSGQSQPGTHSCGARLAKVARPQDMRNNHQGMWSGPGRSPESSWPMRAADGVLPADLASRFASRRAETRRPGSFRLRQTHEQEQRQSSF